MVAHPSQSQAPRRWHHRKHCGGGDSGRGCGWMTTLPKLTVVLVVFGSQRHNPFVASSAAFQSLSLSCPSSPLAFLQRSTRAPSRAARSVRPKATFATTITRMAASKKSQNDDDGELLGKNPGMGEAFRQLESLRSLDDPEEYIPAPEKIKLDQQALADTSGLSGTTAAAGGTSTGTETVSTMEQDFEVYKDMAAELERNEDDAAYAELLQELGGSALQTDDVYSQVLNDLGGTSSTSGSGGNAAMPTQGQASSASTLSTDEFMEQALQEALKEVKVNNPKLSNNILNDKEIMAEIEDIFERGNEKLMASLEEIRQEQVCVVMCAAVSLSPCICERHAIGVWYGMKRLTASWYCCCLL
jgi:hypothetical protein